jgi:hypothetical protein
LLLTREEVQGAQDSDCPWSARLGRGERGAGLGNPASPGSRLRDRVALADPPSIIHACRTDYESAMRADGSFFANAAQCISYAKSGNTVYFPTHGTGAVYFYGDPLRPNYALDIDGNPVTGNAVNVNGSSYPPNLAMHIDYQYPTGVSGTISLTTSDTGSFLEQLPGIQVYHPDGSLWLTALGDPMLVLPCSQTGRGLIQTRVYTPFGEFTSAAEGIGTSLSC